MKNRTFISALILLVTATSAFAQWKPQGNKIKTRWAQQVTPDNVWKEYPRPIMQRESWQNLNGLWEYAVVNRTADASRQKFDGQILVPFSIESSLSGVMKTITDKEEIIYQRSFTVPSAWKNDQILLHFGAVDWKAEVWVNNTKVGEHTGGYTPFSFDITACLEPDAANTLRVKVWDPTNHGIQARGKQSYNPQKLWYSAVSGIWQTVWLEPVPLKHINQLRITPDIDKNRLTVNVRTRNTTYTDWVEIDVYDGNQKIATAKNRHNYPVELNMPQNAKLWSPDSPFLYTLKVRLLNQDTVVDSVSSYAAMRKFSTYTDKNGIKRFALNNKPIFQLGLLDQGWWPDGLYTAPTAQALAYDIEATKELGYNLIRKHVKVEPALWYTYCDRLGIMVWQDIPNSDNESTNKKRWIGETYFKGPDYVREAESEKNYRKELKEIMDNLYSYPCICSWVTFNERWGQFKTQEIVAATKLYDPTRLVNPASGGNHFKCGDIVDIHHYPDPILFFRDPERITVLGEFGGIALINEGHLWSPGTWKKNLKKNKKEATDAYIQYANTLLYLIPKGFSAAVYTQTTDVETEINGLITYDRKKIKLDKNKLRKINKEICEIFNERPR